MLGAVERVERRELAEEPCQLLVLQALLLEEVRDGRGEREHEERVAHEVHRDVNRQDRAPVVRVGLAHPNEARREEKRERERRDERADDVDAVAAPEREVDRAGEHRRDAQREVDALDRADVEDERRRRDVDGVQGGRDEEDRGASVPARAKRSLPRYATKRPHAAA